MRGRRTLPRHQEPTALLTAEGEFGGLLRMRSISVSPLIARPAEAGPRPQTFSAALVMRENMSTGTGKTRVVFFSTPISVSV